MQHVTRNGFNYSLLCPRRFYSRATIVFIYINPFIANSPFLYPMKTSENLTVLEKGFIGNKWVNDLRCVIRRFSVHFSHDTNILNWYNLIQSFINEQLTHDLKNLTNMPNAWKTCLNIGRCEIVIQRSQDTRFRFGNLMSTSHLVLFKSARKETDVPFKLKLNG